MKRRNFSGFFAGMLTMLLIVAMVGSASATTGTVTKEIEYRNIAVSLDGTKLDLKDAKGNTVEPFMFNGTNYIPARALAEALGMSVSWDSATSTIVLKSANCATPSTSASTETDKLIYDNNNIKIYYLGITESSSYIDGYDINVRIENSSSNDYIVQVRDLSVNGYMTTGVLSSSVVAGKKNNDKIIIYKSDLEKNSISSIDTVEFKFVAYNSADWSNSSESPIITITK